jgi:inositol-hexakisphosphate kinase
MDELQTGLSLSKFHNNDSTQLNSIFKSAQIASDLATADLHHHHLHLSNNCSSSSNPIASSTARKSLSSSSNPLNEFLKPHSILSQNNSSESDDDDDSNHHHDEINLYPLSNQVGGHTRLLLLNDKTVIKPLNIRELEFYQNIPGNDIQHFVPKYKGSYVPRNYFN